MRSIYASRTALLALSGLMVGLVGNLVSQPATASETSNCDDFDGWVSGTSYAGGDTVSHFGAVYRCKDAPASGWCGQIGYEPGQSLYWENAWDLVDTCEIDPSTLPRCFDATPAWQADTDYASGDHVVGLDGGIYRCNGWPSGAHCGSEGYAPGDPDSAWSQAWTHIESCQAPDVSLLAVATRVYRSETTGKCMFEATTFVGYAKHDATRAPDDSYFASTLDLDVPDGIDVQAFRTWPASEINNGSPDNSYRFGREVPEGADENWKIDIEVYTRYAEDPAALPEADPSDNSYSFEYQVICNENTPDGTP